MLFYFKDNFANGMQIFVTWATCAMKYLCIYYGKIYSLCIFFIKVVFSRNTFAILTKEVTVFVQQNNIPVC
jgi:hypothetical protein